MLALFGMLVPWLRCPAKPAAELIHMNRADTAAASFILPQPIIRISGLSMMPPPIPIRPEKNPITPPERIPLPNIRGIWSIF